MLVRTLFNLAETCFKFEKVRNQLAEKVRPNALGVDSAVAMGRSNIYRSKAEFVTRFFNKSTSDFFNIAVCHADAVNRCKNRNSASA